MILASNCPHDNGIYTIVDNAEGVVIKSSYTAEGIARLSWEYAGYQWYLRQKGTFENTPLRFVRHDNGLYGRLFIKLFSGRTGECYKSLGFNRRDLLRAIDAYAKVWPRQEGALSPLHGDFSLGNLIIREEEISIIDWEHFRLDAAPWGFDLVNLLYESAFFSLKGKNSLSRSDAKVFIKTRKEICKMLNRGEDFNCTIENLILFISTNAFVWGNLVNKLPVMKFSDAQKSFLKLLEQQV